MPTDARRRPAKGMVRRAVSSRPPERPWRGGGANWVGPEDHPEPADWGCEYHAPRPVGGADVVVGVVGSGSSLTARPHAPANFLRRRSPSSHIHGLSCCHSGRRREWSGGPSRAGRAYWARSVSAERTSEVNPRPEAWGSTSLLVLTTPMTPCPEAGSKAMNERKPPWSPV